MQNLWVHSCCVALIRFLLYALLSFSVQVQSLRLPAVETQSLNEVQQSFHDSTPGFHIHSWNGSTSSQIIHNMSSRHLVNSKTFFDAHSPEAKIIFVNAGYGGPEDGVLQPCSSKCVITRSANAASSAHAIVWNPRWMSPLSQPTEKANNQTWVFNFYFEAPIHQKSKVFRSMVQQFNNRIDLTMTFNSKSDIWEPSAQFTPLKFPRQGEFINYAEGRQHLMLWFVSNCESERFRFMKSLQEWLPPNSVHIFGKCGAPSPCLDRDEGSECHRKLFSKYKFYAAFENGRCEGYITEKFVRPYLEGMVPVALGGMGREDYEKLAPGDSFLHVEDFESVQALAIRLVEMKDLEYNSFFNWKTNYMYDPSMNIVQPYCRLCDHLHGNLVELKSSSQYRSMEKWWFEETCRSSSSSGSSSSSSSSSSRRRRRRRPRHN